MSISRSLLKKKEISVDAGRGSETNSKGFKRLEQ